MNKVKQAIEELKQGKLIVVLDDMDRENEGDLIGLPEFMSAETINFMITHGKGLLCAPISYEVAKKHGLSLAPQGKSDGTNFALSIDGPRSTTGISAFERMDTFTDLLSEEAVEFMTPGHLFPLFARPGGLSVRRGHTEASVDLAKLAGSKEVAAIIEIIKEDGTMMRRDDLIKFSDEHNLTFITIVDLVAYIKENTPEIWDIKNETIYSKSMVAKLPTQYGEFDIQVIKDSLKNKDYTLITNGDVSKMENPFLRVHSQCITSESFGSHRCDCSEQLQEAFKIIAKEGGIILYTPDEGRGIGIFNKINAYHKQDNGLDTVEANIALGFKNETRDFDTPGLILKELGINSVKLMTNNPLKIDGLKRAGINVARVGFWVDAHDEAQEYIDTKIKKMHHIK